MKRFCSDAQELLIDHGSEALRADPTLSVHVNDCDACYQLLISLEALDAELMVLPSIEAPDALIEQTLARIAASPALTTNEPPLGEARDRAGGSTGKEAATDPEPSALQVFIQRIIQAIQGRHVALGAVLAFLLITPVAAFMFLTASKEAGSRAEMSAGDEDDRFAPEPENEKSGPDGDDLALRVMEEETEEEGRDYYDAGILTPTPDPQAFQLKLKLEDRRVARNGPAPSSGPIGGLMVQGKTGGKGRLGEGKKRGTKDKDATRGQGQGGQGELDGHFRYEANNRNGDTAALQPTQPTTGSTTRVSSVSIVSDPESAKVVLSGKGKGGFTPPPPQIKKPSFNTATPKPAPAKPSRKPPSGSDVDGGDFNGVFEDLEQGSHAVSFRVGEEEITVENGLRDHAEPAPEVTARLGDDLSGWKEQTVREPTPVTITKPPVERFEMNNSEDIPTLQNSDQTNQTNQTKTLQTKALLGAKEKSKAFIEEKAAYQRQQEQRREEEPTDGVFTLGGELLSNTGDLDGELDGKSRDALVHLNKKITGGDTTSFDFDSTVGLETTLENVDRITPMSPQPLRRDVGRETSAKDTKNAQAPSELDREMARGFLAEREVTKGLSYQAARGYWANTYVPGDPLLRQLEQQLEQHKDLRLGAGLSSGFALTGQAGKVQQPFDAPTNSALSVYMTADQRATQGPQRMILQVGIKGTARRSGRRAAMNVGVVLDLSQPLGDAEREQVAALLKAFSQSRDIGDRFSLVIAGQPGGMVIEPGAFPYGQVTVASRRHLTHNLPFEERPTLNLDDAYQLALQTVGGSDDPGAPLGSSLVILVTPNDLSGQADRLSQLAHVNAVAGVQTSAIAVGSAHDSALDQITLSGQGNRRALMSEDDASTIVLNELTAAGRVIARAVRLRIRLASGVKLVDVLGSHSLSEQKAEQVRRAEQSIDQRISKNLGIDSDRGEDEDGIQIVLPMFYAGDSHVILLDVVASGPGPIADVTAKYKDLVFLRNGVAEDTLQLRRGEAEPGPLEQNVTRNLLSHRLSQTLQRAAEQVEAGQYTSARALLEREQGLLRGLRAEVAGLSSDPELGRDGQLLTDYASASAQANDGSLERLQDLIHSLYYTSYRKRLPWRSE